jgi:hypothetical protein
MASAGSQRSLVVLGDLDGIDGRLVGRVIGAHRLWWPEDVLDDDCADCAVILGVANLDREGAVAAVDERDLAIETPAAPSSHVPRFALSGAVVSASGPKSPTAAAYVWATVSSVSSTPIK